MELLSEGSGVLLELIVRRACNSIVFTGRVDKPVPIKDGDMAAAIWDHTIPRLLLASPLSLSTILTRDRTARRSNCLSAPYPLMKKH